MQNFYTVKILLCIFLQLNADFYSEYANFLQLYADFLVNVGYPPPPNFKIYIIYQEKYYQILFNDFQSAYIVHWMMGI